MAEDPRASQSSPRRLRWLARIFLAWAVIVFGRLFYLQVSQNSYYEKLAEKQHTREVEIQSPRGDLLDRASQPLALSLPVPSICVNPRLVRDPAMAAEVLSGVLQLNRKEVEARIIAAKARHRGFLWIKRKASAEEPAYLIVQEDGGRVLKSHSEVDTRRG